MGNNAYKSAGVDVEKGYETVRRIKKHVESTFRNEVLSSLGGFGGLFSIANAKAMEEPVLVSGTDGVGTKLKIAFLMDKHDTVGIDCVAMCVNDIICTGAEPLFFLDYIACGKNFPEKIELIVKGMAEGCRMANTALIGGETAEMPGFYPDNEYDLSGFAVGLLDKPNTIDGKNIAVGDTIIGLASSGLHSNGFSLVRRIVRPSELNINAHIEVLGCTLGEALLKPTKIYVKPILNAIKEIDIKGICNITGGGLIENIPRMLPDGLKAKIDSNSWNTPAIFEFLMNTGDVEIIDMYNTFNMGIGMALVVKAYEADRAVDFFESQGEKAYKIGTIEEGTGIDIC